MNTKTVTYSKAIVHKAIIRKSKAGGYWAEVPSMPGCFSQAETLPEMRRMIGEAMELWEPGCFSVPKLSDEDAEIKPELVQAIFKHCGIPEEGIDESRRKSYKQVHLSAYVDCKLLDQAERKAKRFGHSMYDVLAQVITATYETIAGAKGNPFAG